MSLSDLIRGKPVSVAVATATPATSATSATRQTAGTGTVATVATVAVAKTAKAPPEKWPAWRLHFPDGESLDVSFCPAFARADALSDYPHAIKAEPTPERLQRAATEAEARELHGLIEAVYGGETDADKAEALNAALKDPAGALRCYRAILKARNT